MKVHEDDFWMKSMKSFTRRDIFFNTVPGVIALTASHSPSLYTASALSTIPETASFEIKTSGSVVLKPEHGKGAT